jgi:hypothetical protein
MGMAGVQTLRLAIVSLTRARRGWSTRSRSYRSSCARLLARRAFLTGSRSLAAPRRFLRGVGLPSAGLANAGIAAGMIPARPRSAVSRARLVAIGAVPRWSLSGWPPVSTRASVGTFTPARRTANQLGCDSGCVSARRTDQFDALSLRAVIRLRGRDRSDRDPFDLELGFRPDHVARLGALVQKRPVDNAPGLFRTSGAPRPSSVGSRAGQLDVYAPGHDTKAIGERLTCRVGASG